MIAPRIDAASDAEVVLDARLKSVPAHLAPLSLRELRTRGLRLLDGAVLFPAAVLKQRALDDNRAHMRAFLAATGAVLAPHGKTTMAPQLFRAQLDDGAWGITVATVAQLQIALEAGVRRVVLANQLVGAQAIRVVRDALAADAAREIVTLVDSRAGVEALAAALRASPLPRPLPLLLEVGFEGGRTGCRTMEEALAVARAVAREPTLALVGVEGFEGLIHSHDVAHDVARVRAFLSSVVEVARACAAAGLFAPGRVWLSAGGSAYYDLVTDVLGAAALDGAQVLLRSGCYLAHDAGAYAGAWAAMRGRTPPPAAVTHAPRAALEVWGQVQSRPEPERVIVNVGKRDVGIDLGLPVALAWSRAGAAPQALTGCEVVEINDQHVHLRVHERSPLAFGDLVGFGVSHPCTTFDKWQVLWVVDDDYRIVDAIRTFF